MKTFNSGEKSLMAKLGITTLKEMETFYKGWKESSFECRANGIRTMSFDKYLEIRLIWRKATWSKL
jgi:hypothetical protein